MKVLFIEIIWLSARYWSSHPGNLLSCWISLREPFNRSPHQNIWNILFLIWKKNYGERELGSFEDFQNAVLVHFRSLLEYKFLGESKNILNLTTQKVKYSTTVFWTIPRILKPTFSVYLSAVYVPKKNLMIAKVLIMIPYFLAKKVPNYLIQNLHFQLVIARKKTQFILS